MMRKVYPVNLAKETIAGIPVRIITPLDIPASKQNRVLINLHGGGFTADWGSEIETIPIANLTQTKIVAVLDRLAPEHPFPAAVDDAVAVYKELLKTYKPQNIGLYGTSAGAILTAEVASRLRQLGLPLPAALGIFSGNGDFSEFGDSIYMYGLWGLSGPISRWTGKHDTGYTATTNLKDPVLSPIYADLKDFPPTLFLTSARDLLLSNTVNLHRAFLRAGDNAQLVVFDGLPHAFWNDWKLARVAGDVSVDHRLLQPTVGESKSSYHKTKTADLVIRGFCIFRKTVHTFTQPSVPDSLGLDGPLQLIVRRAFFSFSCRFSSGCAFSSSSGTRKSSALSATRMLGVMAVPEVPCRRRVILSYRQHQSRTVRHFDDLLDGARAESLVPYDIAARFSMMAAATISAGPAVPRFTSTTSGMVAATAFCGSALKVCLGYFWPCRYEMVP